MISYARNEISLDGIVEKIKEFRVMFTTRAGLCTMEEAVAYCVANDLDPDLMIQSCGVAISETMYEVLLR